MHFILGFLTSIVTVLWLLHRLAEMGIDLGGWNPFLWRQRDRWTGTFDQNPLFSIESPMEATAVLLVAVAKADGDMSAPEKFELRQIFEKEFHMSKLKAAGLLVASAHLLGDGEAVKEKVDQVLAPSLANFSPDQARSAKALMQRVAEVDGDPSELQRMILESAVRVLDGRLDALDSDAMPQADSDD